MSDIRRTLLFVAFTMSLVLLWDGWNKHNGHTSMFAPPALATAPEAAASAALPTNIPTAAPTALPAATPGAATGGPVESSKVVVITTDVLIATIDTRGGAMVRLELLGQPDVVDRTRNVVLFDQSAKRLYTGESGWVGEGVGGPLPNQYTTMALEPGPTTLVDGANDLTVRLVSTSAGVKWTKTYSFRRGDFVIGVQQELANLSDQTLSPQLYFQLQRDGNPPEGESSMYSTFTGPVMYTDAAKFTKVAFKDIDKRQPGDKPTHDIDADNGWVGVVQHYFATAWLLGSEGDDKRARRFETKKVGKNLYAISMTIPMGALAPGATVALPARLFAGPQEEYKLDKLATGLELVRDYGILTILSKPLFWLLNQLNNYLGNWGWAIMALVVILKIAFYWLNAKAYRSMGKMKAVAPRITEMRERLKDNPQQMQQEMMRIYREEKVNPIGGCLPMLIQMPFFFALYSALLSSAEMRGAPWIGWITDLTIPDPYYILPVIMAATGLVQTWLNPTPPDPMQAKMMWIMPLAFSAMFFVFPAGLVLYWLTNNVLSIAQQYLINKQLGVNK